LSGKYAWKSTNNQPMSNFSKTDRLPCQRTVESAWNKRSVI